MIITLKSINTFLIRLGLVLIIRQDDKNGYPHALELTTSKKFWQRINTETERRYQCKCRP